MEKAEILIHIIVTDTPMAVMDTLMIMAILTVTRTITVILMVTPMAIHMANIRLVSILQFTL